MRILLVHNRYLQPGGEDVVFAAERALLTRSGHEVVPFIEQNAQFDGLNLLGVAVSTVWSRAAQRRLSQMLQEMHPDVVHFHNIFPMISPAAYYVCRKDEVPVVQTLHNYRLLCPNALFFRDGHICEDCMGKIPWPGVVHACYRGSRAASTVIAAMLVVHRFLGTWTQRVDMYIALTEFARQKFIEGGLPAEKIAVKPNFVHPDPGPGEGQGGFALFVGRLSQEKGLDTLLAAWERLQGRVSLKIVGDGPLASEVAAAAERLDGVEWLGRKPREEVLDLMKQASFLILPSKIYENFPMTIAEAFATGLPVVASNLGAMATLIDHERTGLHFRPGGAEDLAAKVEWLLSHPVVLTQMRKEARAEYEAKYTAERNYRMLMEIYARAIENARKG